MAIDIRDIRYISRISAIIDNQIQEAPLRIEDPSCLWLPWSIRLARAVCSLAGNSAPIFREESASTIVDDDDLTLADVSDLTVLMSVVGWSRGSMLVVSTAHAGLIPYVFDSVFYCVKGRTRRMIEPLWLSSEPKHP